MVFSFSMAILIASRSIPRQVAFAIFVGTAKLHGHIASIFTSGLHAAFYASMSFLALAAVLSAMRGRHGPVRHVDLPVAEQLGSESHARSRSLPGLAGKSDTPHQTAADPS